MGNKSSSRAGRHPYLNPVNWLGPLAFWRRKRPGALESYAVDMYEESIREMVKNERNLTVLESNIKKTIIWLWT